MSLSLYDVSVPVFLKMLGNLSGILDKAAVHAASAGVAPGEMIGRRLAPDMWSLGEQVRAVANFPVRFAARLGGLPIPTFEGRDDSFPALKDRLAWAAAFAGAADRATIEAGAEKPVTFAGGGGEHTMSGRDYFLTFVLPNFYFHLTAAYCILRQEGVPLQKTDWLGPVGN